mgnify:FL=1
MHLSVCMRTCKYLCVGLHGIHMLCGCPQMMSVANARCDGSIEFTSQKNKQVSISAPGMAILSSVPRWMGIVRGHISTSPEVTNGAKPVKMAGWLPNGFLVSPTSCNSCYSTQHHVVTEVQWCHARPSLWARKRGQQG